MLIALLCFKAKQSLRSTKRTYFVAHPVQGEGSTFALLELFKGFPS